MFVPPPFSTPTVAQVAHLTLAAFEREYWAGHRNMPDVNYVGGSRQLRRRVTPGPPPAMAGGGDSEK